VQICTDFFFWKIKAIFILHLFQILNLLNYGKPEIFKTTALASAAFALQSFKGTEKLKILQTQEN
jgi:hypothetical protein